MKKRLLLMMAFVLSFMMGANAQVTEVLEAPSADKATFTGTSFTAGEGGQLTTGTQDVSGKTFLKIRTGNEGNSLTFSVIDGYAITGISMDAYSNNKSTSADRSINLTAVNIDEAESSILENVVKLPGGTAGQTPVNVSLSGFEAKKSIKMTFNNSNIVTETEDPAGKNKQIFAYIEVTYIALNADPVAEPAIKFTAGAAERTITLGLSAAGKVSVDWGNGEKVEQETAAAYDGSNGLEFTGTPSGEVKIYGENIIYFEAFTKMTDGKIIDGITAIDLSNATSITELDIHQNALTTLDLSKLTALTSLNIGVNDFTSIDLSALTELVSLDITNGKLTELDLSKNTKLTKVVLSGNKLQTLDFTNNPLIRTFTVLNNELTNVTIGANTAKGHTFQFGGNKLTSFSLKDVADVATSFVYLRDNSLTSLELPSKVRRMWLDGNAFTLAQLAALKDSATQTFTYATTFTKPQAQAPYVIDKVIESGDAIDLSSQAKLGETETVFTWINKADTLKAGTDYTVENGVFTFLTAQDSLYCVMTNTELPLIKYTTTATRVVVLPVAIKLTAGNVERSITVGLSDAGIVKVDWGNGELIKKIAAAAYDGWDNALEFTGTPSGEVKIYGENINYLQSFTKYADGATVITDGITAIDLSNAATITELDLHQNNLTAIDLSKLTALTSLNIGVNDFTTIDLSANTKLTKIDLSNGKNNGVLESVDLTKNTKLTNIVLSGNKLTSLDLSKNAVAKTITVLNNQLTSVTFGENTAKNHTINLGGNKLTTIDLTQFTTYAGMYLRVRDNDLTEIKLPGQIKQLWADGNNFTLPQLYALKNQAQTLTYATTFTKPQAQAPYAIAESVKSGETIDLSSQALLGETATEFVWINKADTLKAGTDYNVENGVFTFLTAQDSLYCEMTNAELPAIKYTTTATKVEAKATGIQTIQMKGIEKIYNMKGQRIAAPVKGLYIRNGKKYVK